MPYALFLGCTAPVRARNYEISTRKVAQKLGIELVDVDAFSCCGFPVEAVDRETALLLAARNLMIAEGYNLDVVTLCSACTSILTEVAKRLSEDEVFRIGVNETLRSLGRESRGLVKVRHFVRMLHEDIGVAGIREALVRDLSGLRFASHYGCHYLKPSEIYDGFDNPEDPTTLDELIGATGAECVYYEERLQCCGGAVVGIDEKIALSMARDKVEHAQEAEADAIVLICPFCGIMYDANQRKIENLFQEKLGMPVLYYPQLLGLGLGFSPDELGFKINSTKSQKFMERIRSLPTVKAVKSATEG
jgi:heterodisulfide reductase subunit B